MDKPPAEYTLKLRQEFVDAKTEKELDAARKAIVADLKKRYAGIDCHAPQDTIGPHLMLFGQLMQEWNPIGFTIEELKGICGRPTTETKDAVTYTFDSGMKAPLWMFKGQPRIVEVRHHGGQ